MKKLRFVLLLVFCLTNIVPAEDMIKAAGTVFINSAGEKKEAVLSGKIVGFYFAGEAEPCKSFTTKLLDLYSSLKQTGCDFEIIYVGAVNSSKEMLQCMQNTKMPWLAVPYDSEETKVLKQIKRAGFCGVRIPALIIIRDGQLVTERGVTDVRDAGLAAYQKWMTMVPETGSGRPSGDKTAPVAGRAPLSQRPETEQIPPSVPSSPPALAENDNATPVDPAKERKDLSVLRQKAEQGNEKARVDLGVAYAKGDGVPKDYAEAIKWLQPAAVQGNAEAQFILGDFYRRGLGVSRDDKEAVRLYRCAAEQGHALAQFSMGRAYATSGGVSYDPVQAYAWISAAATQGNKQATDRLPLIVKDMTPAQIAEGQALSKTYVKKFVSLKKNSSSFAAPELLPAPHKKEICVDDLKSTLPYLDGEIIKLTINYVQRFSPVSETLYGAVCGNMTPINYSRGVHPQTCLMLIPENGKKIFAALSVKATSGVPGDNDQTVVYVQVHSKTPIRIGNTSFQLVAVGSRYSQSENEYTWPTTMPAQSEEFVRQPSSETAPEAEAASGLPPAPYKKEMDINELKAACLNLDGKVVKTSFNYVLHFEKIAAGLYKVYCGYSKNGYILAPPVLIPEEGKKFFEPLPDKQDVGYKTVYLRVHGKRPIKVGKDHSFQLEAVGTRYSKSKNEYGW